MERVVEVQRHWRVEFGTPPPKRVITRTRLRDKFEVDGMVHDLLKGRWDDREVSLITRVLMHVFAGSPRESLRQCSREISIEKSSVHRMLRAA